MILYTISNIRTGTWKSWMEQVVGRTSVVPMQATSLHYKCPTQDEMPGSEGEEHLSQTRLNRITTQVHLLHNFTSNVACFTFVSFCPGILDIRSN